MNIKHKLLLTAAAVVVSGGTMLSSTQVFAQGSTTDTNPMSSLAQRVADKFGLNKEEVQAVFAESRTEMTTKRQTQYEDRLSQLVADGKITDAQKQLIIAKNNELEASRQSKRASSKDQTGDERKAAMESERAALEEWATQNGIDIQYLMSGKGGRGTAGFRHKANQM